jgi:hypothetical protein
MFEWRQKSWRHGTGVDSLQTGHQSFKEVDAACEQKINDGSKR